MLGLRFESEETVAGRGGVGIEAFLSRSRSRRCWNGAGLNGAGLRVRGGAGSCVGAGWVQGSSRHGEGRDATGVGGRGWAIVAVVGQSRGRGNRGQASTQAIADRHRHGPRHRPARIPGGAPPGRAAPTPAPWQSRTGIDTAIADRQSRTGIDTAAITGAIAGNRGQASTSARSRVAADGSVDRGQASTRPQASTSPNPRRRATRPGRPYPRPVAIADRHRHGNRGQAIADRHRHGGNHGGNRGQSRTGIDIGTIAGSRGRVSRSRTGIDTAPGIDQPKSPAARHQAGPPLPPPRVLAPRGRSASGRSIAGFSARRLRRGLRRRFGRSLARRRRSLVDLGEVVVGQ